MSIIERVRASCRDPLRRYARPEVDDLIEAYEALDTAARAVLSAYWCGYDPRDFPGNERMMDALSAALRANDGLDAEDEPDDEYEFFGWAHHDKIVDRLVHISPGDNPQECSRCTPLYVRRQR